MTTMMALIQQQQQRNIMFSTLVRGRTRMLPRTITTTTSHTPLVEQPYTTRISPPTQQHYQQRLSLFNISSPIMTKMTTSSSSSRSTHLLLRQRMSSMAAAATTTTLTTDSSSTKDSNNNNNNSTNSMDDHVDENAPHGDLWTTTTESGTTTPTVPLCSTTPPSEAWVGRTGRIRRTFGAQANADAMLVTGGAALAAHASFDPHYGRAVSWIHNHAVGPAVLSPICTAGLLYALTEAAFPHAVPRSQSLFHEKPLIVGVPVYATIRVAAVTRQPQHYVSSSEKEEEEDTATSLSSLSQQQQQQQYGYQIDLKVQVSRVRDDKAIITHGDMSIWLPDYRHL